jgi:hypothetical protein
VLLQQIATSLTGEDAETAIGRSAPLGAAVSWGGVNFGVFSRNASCPELVLFDDP